MRTRVSRTRFNRLHISLAAACLAISFGCENREPRKIDSPGRIRVACVGDSITYGLGMSDRAKNCYPAQLARLLGERYEVRNFGVSGATMLRKGTLPYRDQRAFIDASRYDPDIVVIMLGTNDTAYRNWLHKNEFAPDYADMVEHFDNLPSAPGIFICLPPPLYENGTEIHNEAIPIIRRVAKEKGVTVIDLDEALSGKAELFPDGVHPDASGALIMAEKIFRILSARQYPESHQ